MTPDEARQRFVDEHQSFKDAAASLREHLDNLCRTLRVPATVEASGEGYRQLCQEDLSQQVHAAMEKRSPIRSGARIIVGTLQDVREASSRPLESEADGGA